MRPKDLVLDMLRASDAGDFERFRARLAPDCEWHNPVIQATGADEIAAGVAAYSADFRRRHHDVSLLLESGDTVAVEGDWVATHAPTGHTVTVAFAAVIRTRDDRVEAVRVYLDPLGMMEQLGMTAAAA
jgi:ketosteroid isomerase-like protein